jgi:hypothetical protein
MASFQLTSVATYTVYKGNAKFNIEQLLLTYVALEIPIEGPEYFYLILEPVSCIKS